METTAQVYLTKEEIETIDKLKIPEIFQFVKDFSPEKKELAMKIFEKNVAISQLEYRLSENY